MNFQYHLQSLLAWYFLRHPPTFSVPVTPLLAISLCLEWTFFPSMSNKHRLVLWISIQIFLFLARNDFSNWIDPYRLSSSSQVPLLQKRMAQS